LKIKKIKKMTAVERVSFTPYSFSVTFFTLWPSPFLILLQINNKEWKDMVGNES
jgi:hypothetical protein